VTLKPIAHNPDIRSGMGRAEIDAAIAQYAETETLFDQPYEDGKVVRVSGPFEPRPRDGRRPTEEDRHRQVRETGEGMIELEVRGLDVYDPTTGVLRSSSVDDIAAWFLDTNYDGDAFFVRHAYFTGADDPYGKLRKALRADISDEAWATLNSNVSRPFPRPVPSRERQMPVAKFCELRVAFDATPVRACLSPSLSLPIR
jgi:hypothetical protein